MAKRSEAAKETSARCKRLGKIARGWIFSPIQSFHSESQAARYARACAHLALRISPKLREPRNLPDARSEHRSSSIPDGHYKWRDRRLGPSK